MSPILRISGCGFYTSYGEVEATAIQSQTGSAGTISQEGAIIAADGDVFFANRIDDAFAIVDAGAPGHEVSYENRPVARTDASGKIIVPTLNAYQPNKISIDPRDLPLNASITTTQELLAPPDRSGVLVDFGIATDVRSGHRHPLWSERPAAPGGPAWQDRGAGADSSPATTGALLLKG